MRWTDEEYEQRVAAAEARPETEPTNWSDDLRAKMRDLPMGLWTDEELVAAMRGGELVADFSPEPQPNPRCYACDTELLPVFDGPGAYDRQCDNVLDITFSGGYGMFIDPCMEADPRVLICHDCSHQACETLPWLNKLLQPQHSHSHRSDYWKTHPDHEGWDKDYGASGDE